MKPGTKISFTRRNGETVRAKVIESVTKATGAWLSVQPLNDTGKPFGKPVSIRPSQAQK